MDLVISQCLSTPPSRAALLPTLRQHGPDAARAAAAALYSLAKLGIDPGEEFCDACMAVAEADSGQDWDLLSTTAHSLAVLQASSALLPGARVAYLHYRLPHADKPGGL